MYRFRTAEITVEMPLSLGCPQRPDLATGFLAAPPLPFANAGRDRPNADAIEMIPLATATRTGATIRMAGRPSGWSIDRLQFPTDSSIGPWWLEELASQRWGNHRKPAAVGRIERNQGLKARPVDNSDITIGVLIKLSIASIHLSALFNQFSAASTQANFARSGVTRLNSQLTLPILHHLPSCGAIGRQDACRPRAGSGPLNQA